ncbi:STE family protein kinase [Trichomonas vaginalis G3]|uniref:mitogen-activated protein kinase kinase n=1 Tax=Trichomonas vaginalis (strain ATCC PRA-98 / G3) TaxID=412133 RepID=A2EML4_TRIV3|nr:MAP kinase kinase protein [Trichomonas vaginalis G3]EAY06084.1 STE family protein kinase [Trichomonas vaginalis G3]KAI5497123.1 MAP kinase kinase protein [Trichomonas vaginalis G3]|eukprot:XP_001318307.1 STE family protein kinase [Trichomonas vaginalis G3]
MTSIRSRKGKKELLLNIPKLEQPITIPKNLSSNITLKDLTFLDFVGKGAFSTVYRVKMNDTGEIYALKKIKYAETQEQLKVIVNEIDCMNTLRHPNVLRLYNVFYQSGAIHIIMPYINGLTLAEALKIMPIPPEAQLGRISYLAVQGLHYLRKNAYIHRDLKPSNILLSLEGQVLIADFGLARQLTASSEQACSYVGTISYMAPERIKGKEYQFKSDVWSLGIIIYQMALGHFPLPKDPAQVTYWDILDFVDKEVRIELPDPYAPDFKAFLMKCLYPNPEQRSDVNELVNDPWIQKFSSPAYDADLKKWINEMHQKHMENKKSAPTLGDSVL